MKYVLIDKNNLILATRVQLEIFPKEIAFTCYKKSIEDNHEHYKYYLVYKNDIVIGITGLYTENNFEDNSIWIGWYGVLEEYRLHGFGEEILKDTINMAKKWSVENNKIKYIRLYTSFKHNKIAQILYEQYMDLKEKYNNKNDINYDNTCLVYTKKINNIDKLEYWNNRFLNLIEGENMIKRGFEDFSKLTNGDIHIQISESGEIF